MPHLEKTAGRDDFKTPNDENHYRVSAAQLPLHCPLPDMSLWNSHPRVYIALEETGHGKCPYCGAEYTLVDD